MQIEKEHSKHKTSTWWKVGVVVEGGCGGGRWVVWWKEGVVVEGRCGGRRWVWWWKVGVVVVLW